MTPQESEQKILKLERRVTLLESQFPKSLLGPTPGWLQAAQIGRGPLVQSSMHLNMQGNQAGVAPRASVTDGAGTVRAEFGNLAANGNSPAQFGFRASSAAGVPLFDSLGLIGVMTQVGGTISIGLNQTIASATDIAVTGSTATWSPTRTGNFGVWFSVICSYLGTSLGTGNVNLYLDTVNNAGVNSLPLYWSNVTGPLTLSGFAAPLNLAAGSHSISLKANQSGNLGLSTFTVNSFQTTVFQLGG